MNAPISIPPKRYSLLSFFLLAFGISWAFWVPAALASRGLIPFPISATFPLTAFGPSLAAIVLVVITEGASGLRRLLGRLLVWRVNVLWYAFVLLYPAILSLATTGLYVLFGGQAPDYANPPVLRIYPLPPELLEVGPLVLLPFVFLLTLFISSPMGEEIGWRGYALPRLQAKRGALTASVLLGLLWGLWHLPLYLTRSHPLSGEFFGWYLLGVVAVAILFTWVYNNTRGSLLLALLFHTSIPHLDRHYRPVPLGRRSPSPEPHLAVGGSRRRYSRCGTSQPHPIAGKINRRTRSGCRLVCPGRRPLADER